MEEDVVGLRRVVGAGDLVECELCGRSVPEASVERVAGARNVAEPVEYLQVCEDCRVRLERGEVDLDPIVESSDE
jgi:ribosome-binding protein aMBF1 (putative translation factor)